MFQVIRKNTDAMCQMFCRTLRIFIKYTRMASCAIAMMSLLLNLNTFSATFCILQK